MTSLEFTINGDDFIPVLSFYDNNIQDEYINYVKEIESSLFYTIDRRKTKRKKDESNLIDLICKLERELLQLSHL